MKYTTMDSYLVAFLSLRGVSSSPRLVSNGTKVVFELEQGPALDESIRMYHAGEKVSAIEMVEAIKRVKGMIHSKRREIPLCRENYGNR